MFQLGLGREEFFRINLALKQLTQDTPLVSARFWGKIFGTSADYIIAEAEYQEGEGEEEEEEEEGKEERKEEEEGEGGGDDDRDLDNESSDTEKDEPPKSLWKPPTAVPKEEPKSGSNKKTYFVCNHGKIVSSCLMSSHMDVTQLGNPG